MSTSSWSLPPVNQLMLLGKNGLHLDKLSSSCINVNTHKTHKHTKTHNHAINSLTLVGKALQDCSSDILQTAESATRRQQSWQKSTEK